jgi:hypothetical protein
MRNFFYLRSLSPRLLAAALVAVASLPLAFEPALGWGWDWGWGSAQGHRQSQSRSRSPRQRSEREDTAKTGVKKPAGPMFAVVSLADQHITFYDADGVWERSGVSTGVPGHPTPTGIFTILEKERWHRSNIYSGAPMPFMQRLAWTGVAMHEGAVHEGHTASHGCIRMHADFARRLYGVTNIGQRVIISPQDITPAPIVHTNLPQPKLLAPPFEAGAEKGAKVSIAEPAVLDTQAPAKPKLINPGEYALALKTAAAAKAAEAAKAKKAALALLDVKEEEAAAAKRELDAAETALRKARAELEDAERSAVKAQGEEAVLKAAGRKASAEAKLAAAEAKVKEAGDAKAAKDGEVQAAEASIRAAETAAAEATSAAKQSVRRIEPVSMFISRKSGRLYVRQANVHLFDMPIVIREPGRPIGTHLFIATKPSGDGTSLQWVSLTPPAAYEVKRRPHSSRRGHPVHAEAEVAPVQAFPETAAGALSRIEIPQDAAQRIAELLWTGATLIISDVEMSGEGRFAMDFQILEQTRVREP